MWQREYHMIIGSGQQFIGPFFYPVFLFHTSAIGAVPVATTVVLQFLFVAVWLVATIEVTSRKRGMAMAECLEHGSAIGIEFFYQGIAK